MQLVHTHRRISKSMLYAQVYAIFMYTPPPPERLEILEKKVFLLQNCKTLGKTYHQRTNFDVLYSGVSFCTQSTCTKRIKFIE